MKKLLLLLCLALTAPVLPTGCRTAPTERVSTVVTLKVIGASVDASMKLAAQLVRDQRITWEQWRVIADFHDQKFQPAYNLAVAAVQSDLSSVASPDLLALAGQLAVIVNSYVK